MYFIASELITLFIKRHSSQSEKTAKKWEKIFDIDITDKRKKNPHLEYIEKTTNR